MVSESGMEVSGNWHAGSSWLQRQRPESGDALPSAHGFESSLGISPAALGPGRRLG